MSKTKNLLIAAIMMLGVGCAGSEVVEPTSEIDETVVSETEGKLIRQKTEIDIDGPIVKCGILNQDCCYSKTRGEFCNAGLFCVDGICLDTKPVPICGNDEQACCAGSTCNNANLYCSSVDGKCHDTTGLNCDHRLDTCCHDAMTWYCNNSLTCNRLNGKCQ